MPAVPLSQVAVRLRPEDNVAVASRTLPAGLDLGHDGATLTLTQRVGLGHKVALRAIRKGEAVTKYGQVIGFASRDVPAGAHVHVHNLAADPFERDYAFCRDCPPPPPRPEPRFFMGYDRGDDRHGTRNYVAATSFAPPPSPTPRPRRRRELDLWRGVCPGDEFKPGPGFTE